MELSTHGPPGELNAVSQLIPSRVYGKDIVHCFLHLTIIPVLCGSSHGVPESACQPRSRQQVSGVHRPLGLPLKQLLSFSPAVAFLALPVCLAAFAERTGPSLGKLCPTVKSWRLMNTPSLEVRLSAVVAGLSCGCWPVRHLPLKSRALTELADDGCSCCRAHSLRP